MSRTDEFAGLADDNGRPINWKVTTWVAVAGLMLTLAMAMVSAGAKGERLDGLSKKVEFLEAKAGSVDRVEVRQDEIFRRLGGVEAKIDKLLERR